MVTFLRKSLCDELQGFHFRKPSAADQFLNCRASRIPPPYRHTPIVNFLNHVRHNCFSQVIDSVVLFALYSFFSKFGYFSRSALWHVFAK